MKKPAKPKAATQAAPPPETEDSRPTSAPAPESIYSFFHSAPPEWQPPDPASPRGRILNAARTLFAENGLAATSTRMIAESASVNLAMIHYYYGSKEQLYEQVLAREFVAIMRSMSKLIEPNMPADQMILGLPLRIMAVLQKNPTWITLLRHEVAGGSTHLTHALKSLGGFGPLGLRHVFENTYKSAVRSGKMRDLPSEPLRDCLIAMAYGMMFVQPFLFMILHPDERIDDVYKEIMSVMDSILKRGLLTENRS